MGKTALARAAARAAVAQEWFPGSAVTVDVRGSDPDPALVIWPAQLYAGLLRALGVAGEQIPTTESEQATVYHQLLDRLAEEGRPVLLVIDNVADVEQTAGLLPRRVGGHRVLITSRDTLGRVPDVRLIDLHVPEPEAAVELLAVGLCRRQRDDGRVTADPVSAARLLELCGRLPLAVQIVAGRTGDQPDRPLAELADELTEGGNRLHGLDYDGRWAVRAAFDLSYRRLNPATAELFGWLAAVSGTDVGLGVAAVVADRTRSVARAGLRALCRAHLLDQQPAQPGQGPRWRMHDVIRLYATEQLTPDDQATGFTRVLGHYRYTADLATRRFTALPADLGSVPAGFDTPQQAMAWVLQERAGLIGCVTRAADTHPRDTVRLAADLAPFLHRARLLADWVIVASAAEQATRRSPDRALAAEAWGNLGAVLGEVRRFDEAIAVYERDIAICAELGDAYGQAHTLNNLGWVLAKLDQPERARHAWVEAIELYTAAGAEDDAVRVRRAVAELVI